MASIVRVFDGRVAAHFGPYDEDDAEALAGSLRARFARRRVSRQQPEPPRPSVTVLPLYPVMLDEDGEGVVVAYNLALATFAESDAAIERERIARGLG